MTAGDLDRESAKLEGKSSKLLRMKTITLSYFCSWPAKSFDRDFESD